MREWPHDQAKAEREENASGLLPVHIATESPAENMPQVASEPVMLFLPGGIRLSCHPTQLTDAHVQTLIHIHVVCGTRGSCQD